MTRSLCLVFMATGTAIATLLGDSEVQFRTQVDVVSVPVAVMQGGAPVRGLTATDFELQDNGVPQTILTAHQDELPIDVTLVLSGFRAAISEDYGKSLAIGPLLRESLRPEDRLRLVEAHERVTGRLLGPGEHLPTAESPERRIAGVSLIDALFYAVAWPVEVGRRHLVVALTDGWDSWSTLSPARLPELAARSDAVLQVVTVATPDQSDTMGIQGTPPDEQQRWSSSFRAIADAAARTGGSVRPIRATTPTIEKVIEEFRLGYVLTYHPSGVRPDGWHNITVRMKRSCCRLQWRRGYERR